MKRIPMILAMVALICAVCKKPTNNNNDPGTNPWPGTWIQVVDTSDGGMHVCQPVTMCGSAN